MSEKYQGVRIISDGTIIGTKVYSADGEDLTAKLHIRGIQWKHNAGGIPVAVITSSLAAIEGVADVEHVAGMIDASFLGEQSRNYEYIPEIDKVQTVKPNDGEILVLRASKRVSADIAELIQAQLTEKFPGQKFLILDPDLELLIAKTDDAPIRLQV